MLLRRIKAWLLIVGLVVLAVVAAWKVEHLDRRGYRSLEARPEKVMGTTSRLLAIPPRDAGTRTGATAAGEALKAAEAALREVEAQMSSYIDSSAVALLGRAKRGERISLAPDLATVLEASQRLHEETGGAFDVTCRPLIELWRTAGERDLLPTPEAIAQARAASSWELLLLSHRGLEKLGDGARIDLGGIAKGHAIDRATETLQQRGMIGGLVDVGGDLRVFGPPPSGSAWEIQVQNPVGAGTFLTLELDSGAVCTSGGYFRFVEVGGHRFSHIIDPRSGQPVEGVASATVVASEALEADAWATALSVLGEPGLQRLPEGVDALLVLGEKAAPQAVATRGLMRRITAGPPYPLREAR